MASFGWQEFGLGMGIPLPFKALPCLGRKFDEIYNWTFNSHMIWIPKDEGYLIPTIYGGIVIPIELGYCKKRKDCKIKGKICKIRYDNISIIDIY